MNTVAHKHREGIREHILDTGQRIMASKGYSAVGLNEILTEAGVPKDAFGVAMLESYFDDYLANMDETLSQPNCTMQQRLMHYWQQWQDTQSFQDCQGKCLAVKLGVEVADLSEAMRHTLEKGTAGIVARLTDAIEAGVAEGSLRTEEKPAVVAETLYQLWLGASVMVKIVRNKRPFASAMALTQQMLNAAS
ncbi:MAG: TetR family transcriptional regulator C-terminal domain-containing protein [Pantoea sp.]|nr:TetR family transcriptional regulator C-terminal domain-containing protein [Pantoea sp.]